MLFSARIAFSVSGASGFLVVPAATAVRISYTQILLRLHSEVTDHFIIMM